MTPEGLRPHRAGALAEREAGRSRRQPPRRPESAPSSVATSSTLAPRSSAARAASSARGRGFSFSKKREMNEPVADRRSDLMRCEADLRAGPSRASGSLARGPTPRTYTHARCVVPSSFRASPGRALRARERDKRGICWLCSSPCSAFQPSLIRYPSILFISRHPLLLLHARAGSVIQRSYYPTISAHPTLLRP